MDEFIAWPKTPRLFKDVTVTEKIDGTNACVVIEADFHVYAQSRKRVITPGDDNYGFAAWVEENRETLVVDLGPGRHFGEWWGRGIQRGYRLDDRRFSLFNTFRWSREAEHAFETEDLYVVPTLYVGKFDTSVIRDCINVLVDCGSMAARGYFDPEGVIAYHHASRTSFKAFCDLAAERRDYADG